MEFIHEGVCFTDAVLESGIDGFIAQHMNHLWQDIEDEARKLRLTSVYQEIAGTCKKVIAVVKEDLPPPPNQDKADVKKAAKEAESTLSEVADKE